MEVPDRQVNLAAGLYLVATPVGNLRDVTLRALDVLAACDVIACEDTRVTRRLLDRYSIDTPMIRYDDHSGESARTALIERIAAGQAVALASDAGTPLVSDPGFKLVRAVAEADLRVVPIPGPSAVLAGLSGSGLPTDSFSFHGFLPEKQAARLKRLQDLLARQDTVIVFESARRLPASLGDLASIAANRPVVVARELTKRFEEFRRGSAAELADHYAAAGPPRGEAVLVIGPGEATGMSEADIDRALIDALAHSSVKDAAQAVADLTGLRRRDLYQRALALSKADEEL